MSEPTERELEILEVLWASPNQESTVRSVYEQLQRQGLPIVQNTVQAFLRTMEEKKLVVHRLEGRSFIYQPLVKKNRTQSNIVSGVLKKVFGGAVGQLVRSAFDAKTPSEKELVELEELIAEARKSSSAKKLASKKTTVKRKRTVTKKGKRS